MKEQDIYLSLAARFLVGSSSANDKAHELSGFACYHAFETAGGALVASRGGHYPFNHHAKLNAFRAQCRGKRYEHAVAALAIKLNALRNAFLYPNPSASGWTHPMNLMTAKQVSTLHKRVSGIVSIVKSEV